MFSNIGRIRAIPVLLALVLLIPLALAQPAESASITVQVDNRYCDTAASISQFMFLRGPFPMKVKVLSPPQEVGAGQTKRFSFELEQSPTNVTVNGRSGGEQFSVQVESGGRAEYSCGFISVGSPEEGTEFGGEGQEEGTGETQQPESGKAQLPPQLGNISPGMGPQNVVNELRNRGARVTVQGSRNNPKLGDVSDPLLIGSLPSGFAATGYWVNGPGQLRSVITWDRPSTDFVLVVVSSSFNFCASITPPGGGIEVSCDAPRYTEPVTTIGNSPVPGNVFLVLAIKLGGPSQAYVLSLSG